MSLTKKDRKIRSFSGKTIQLTGGIPPRGSSEPFAASIAAALHREYGDTHAAVKIVVGLTGANERAVKNWFGAKNGPSGEFLISLCRHSDEVLECFLLMASRVELVKSKKLFDAKAKLGEMLKYLDELS